MQFGDPNFKLCVIEQLMYVHPHITPAFRLEEFVKTHTQREIDIEHEGYEIIPEAKQYFDNLPLTPELLEKVEEINVNLVLAQVRKEIAPYWDGEDASFILFSFDDFEHLPNLKKVTDEFHELDEDSRSELRERGVTIER